jgi:hypothetical protein
MTNPIIKDVNVETGEEVEREMTASELSQWQLDGEKFAEQETDRVSKETAKSALLEKLGITAEEATLLLG